MAATRAGGMKMQIEIRRATAAPETEGVVLVGIAVPYNEYTEIHEHGVTFRERFLPGSMEIPESATLKLGHEPGGVPLARAGAGTIEFDPDDPRGLAFRASLPESRRDIVEALERGDLSGAVRRLRAARSVRPASIASPLDDWLADAEARLKADQAASVVRAAVVLAQGQAAAEFAK